MTVDRRATLGVLAVLGAVVAIDVPTLGADPQPFVTPVHAHGVLAPLVRAAGGEWDLGVLRAPGLIAGLLVVAAAVAALRAAAWPRWLLVSLAAAVVCLLLVPGLLLGVGLRASSAPWAYTNDSTYQIDIAGELVLDGENPYGHDYRGTGLERWYEDVRQPTDQGRAALAHFAYFPGTVLTAAVWRVLPGPIDDYRVFVLLATLGLFAAAFAFSGPFELKLIAAVVLSANPLAARAPWFGTADAPSILALVLAFALVTRRRFTSAALCLGAAVLLKQFAVVAVPFFGLALAALGATSRELRRCGVAFGGLVLAGFLPFLIADAGALLDDTIAYGADTYRIVGYGLAGLLVEAGAVSRTGSYPFTWIALLVWAPATAWLLLQQARLRELWTGAAGCAASLFLLFWLSRVFQTSYLVWPLVLLVLAGLLFRSGLRERSSSAYTRDVPTT